MFRITVTVNKNNIIKYHQNDGLAVVNARQCVLCEVETTFFFNIIKMEFMFPCLCLFGQIFFCFLVYDKLTCNQTHVQAMTYKQHRAQHVTTASRCPRQIYDTLLTACAISQPHVMTSHSYVRNDGYVGGVSEHLTVICKSRHDIRSGTSD